MNDNLVDKTGVKVLKVKKASSTEGTIGETPIESVNQPITEIENQQETAVLSNKGLYEADRDIPAHVVLDLLTNALENSRKESSETITPDEATLPEAKKVFGFGKEFYKFISNYITVSITLPIIINLSGFLLLFIMSKIFSMFIPDLTVSWLLLTFTFSIFATKIFTFCYGLVCILKVLFKKEVELNGKLVQMAITFSSLLYPLLALIGLVISWFIFGNLINMTVLTGLQTFIEPTNFAAPLDIFRNSSYADVTSALTNFLQTMGYTR